MTATLIENLKFIRQQCAEKDLQLKRLTAELEKSQKLPNSPNGTPTKRKRCAKKPDLTDDMTLAQKFEQLQAENKAQAEENNQLHEALNQCAEWKHTRGTIELRTQQLKSECDLHVALRGAQDSVKDFDVKLSAALYEKQVIQSELLELQRSYGVMRKQLAQATTVASDLQIALAEVEDLKQRIASLKDQKEALACKMNREQAEKLQNLLKLAVAISEQSDADKATALQKLIDHIEHLLTAFKSKPPPKSRSAGRDFVIPKVKDLQGGSDSTNYTNHFVAKNGTSEAFTRASAMQTEESNLKADTLWSTPKRSGCPTTRQRIVAKVAITESDISQKDQEPKCEQDSKIFTVGSGNWLSADIGCTEANVVASANSEPAQFVHVDTEAFSQDLQICVESDDEGDHVRDHGHPNAETPKQNDSTEIMLNAAPVELVGNFSTGTAKWADSDDDEPEVIAAVTTEASSQDSKIPKCDNEGKPDSWTALRIDEGDGWEDGELRDSDDDVICAEPLPVTTCQSLLLVNKTCSGICDQVRERANGHNRLDDLWSGDKTSGDVDPVQHGDAASMAKPAFSARVHAARPRRIHRQPLLPTPTPTVTAQSNDAYSQPFSDSNITNDKSLSLISTAASKQVKASAVRWSDAESGDEPAVKSRKKMVVVLSSERMNQSHASHRVVRRLGSVARNSK